MELVLSLFPGIGLLDRAFEEAGFCIVRGPDLLWGGDVKVFHPPPGRVDGVIGGPPCQAFSRLVHMVRTNGYKVAENLIPEYERCVAEAGPRWFLMENVPDAPAPTVPGYTVSELLINNRWIGGEQNRVRRFSFGVPGNQVIDLSRFIEWVVLEQNEWAPAVCASGGYRPTPVKMAPGGKVKRTAARNLGWKSETALQEAIRLQGLPPDFLQDAPFTVTGKFKAVGNGVPLPLGRAIAQAVKRALE